MSFFKNIKKSKLIRADNLYIAQRGRCRFNLDTSYYKFYSYKCRVIGKFNKKNEFVDIITKKCYKTFSKSCHGEECVNNFYPLTDILIDSELKNKILLGEKIPLEIVERIFLKINNNDM